jgi:predicted nucleic acid-binding protein
MRSYIVLDTAFVVAIIDGSDAFHTDAVYLFKELIARKDDLKILVPPLVLYEVIVTLRRKGMTAKKLEEILMRLVNLEYVSVIALSELSALKHAAHSLNAKDKSKGLRTHDFLIFCVADEFEGLLITFDTKMIAKCRAVYPCVYFPSTAAGFTDDTAVILQEIDKRAGRDITKIAYPPF